MGPLDRVPGNTAARARRKEKRQIAFSDAYGVFLDTIDDMERPPAGSAWLSGDGFGLADATLVGRRVRAGQDSSGLRDCRSSLGSTSHRRRDANQGQDGMV